MATISNGSQGKEASLTEVHVDMKQPSPERLDDKNKHVRQPRWNRKETLVLIEAKKIAESRGQKGGRRANSASGSGQIELKWDFVSSYCRENGVSRGPVQCRKRWGNLNCDFKKIRVWHSQEGSESYWAMGNDLKKALKLPRAFDRELYDVMDGKKSISDAHQLVLVETTMEKNMWDDLEGLEEEDNEEMTENEETEDELGTEKQKGGNGKRKKIPSPTPISEIKYMPFYQACPTQVKGESTRKSGSQFWRGSGFQEGAKRRKQSSSDCQNSNFDEQIIKALERNNNLMNEMLQAQNLNFQMEREERKNQHENLIGALTKMTDAFEKLANNSE